MATIGTNLFDCIFDRSAQTSALWSMVSRYLSLTEVEIATSPGCDLSIPWELMINPHTGSPVAIEVNSFVRIPDSSRPVIAGRKRIQRIPRILMVICRPHGSQDVPFLAVARGIFRDISRNKEQEITLEVLRPPTFERLGEVLQQANEEGNPYTIVHFDGHGDFINHSDESIDTTIRRGVIYFERHSALFGAATKPYTGADVAHLLRECNVPFLLLNACRSAFNEAVAKPRKIHNDLHDEGAIASTHGSFAEEAVKAGLCAVVAMRYTIHVKTAVLFTREFYVNLAKTRNFVRAANAARVKMRSDPFRYTTFGKFSLHDWAVPILYESPENVKHYHDRCREIPDQTDTTPPATEVLFYGESQIPQAPDIGFHGRDDTILAIDRAFDVNNIVQLTGDAGSGKTTTAQEFAHWYRISGGLRGEIIYTRFRDYRSVHTVLEHAGELFNRSLKAAGLDWSSLTTLDEQWGVIIQILNQVPILWIWDNVEQICGFPSGAKSQWSKEEQGILRRILKDASTTKCKFLLCSRRYERKLLQGIPFSIVRLKPFSVSESFAAAAAIMYRHKKQLDNSGKWTPLIDFADGNPITLRIVFDTVVRAGMDSAEQLNQYASDLRSGSSNIFDQKDSIPCQTLYTSLIYGLQEGFTQNERKVLSLLHFFRGFVFEGTFSCMTNAERTDCFVPEVGHIPRETVLDILHKAAEVGLLTPASEGYFKIHPAVPGFFRDSFHNYFPIADGDGPGLRATRCFVRSMMNCAAHYHAKHLEGDREVIHRIHVDAENFIHAHELAVKHGWWIEAMVTFHVLGDIYSVTGQIHKWRKRVALFIPHVCDPDTYLPRPGLEDIWLAFSEHLLKAYLDGRDAFRVAKLRGKISGELASEAFQLPSEQWNRQQKKLVRDYAASLMFMGEILSRKNDRQCEYVFSEALKLYSALKDDRNLTLCLYSLCDAFLNIKEIYDLEKAVKLAQLHKENIDENDEIAVADNYLLIAEINEKYAFEQIRDGTVPNSDIEDAIRSAINLYERTLRMYPLEMIRKRQYAHRRIATALVGGSRIDLAMDHFNKSIELNERVHDNWGAGLTRFFVALTLEDAGKTQDALLYAERALQNFVTIGKDAQPNIEVTTEVIARIRRQLTP